MSVFIRVKTEFKPFIHAEHACNTFIKPFPGIDIHIQSRISESGSHSGKCMFTCKLLRIGQNLFRHIRSAFVPVIYINKPLIYPVCKLKVVSCVEFFDFEVGSGEFTGFFHCFCGCKIDMFGKFCYCFKPASYNKPDCSNSERCTCGNYGCVERYCSATAIIRMARELCAVHPESEIVKVCEGDLSRVNAKVVFDAAKDGDEIALKVFHRYVKYLGQLVASLVNCIDPEVIVLGGGVSKAGDFLLDAVRAETRRYVLYKTLPSARIELAKLGPDAGIIGAAMLGK